jgi:hypothetical protein
VDVELAAPEEELDESEDEVEGEEVPESEEEVDVDDEEPRLSFL